MDLLLRELYRLAVPYLYSEGSCASVQFLSLNTSSTVINYKPLAECVLFSLHSLDFGKPEVSKGKNDNDSPNGQSLSPKLYYKTPKIDLSLAIDKQILRRH